MRMPKQADRMSGTSMHLVIVEGNHEKLVQWDASGNITGAAEHYAACLKSLWLGLSCSVTRPHFEHDPAPKPDLAACDGVVFTGAGVHWSADDALAKPARDIMEQAFALGKPVFGSCYGLQLGAVVLGGRVGANPNGPELAIARQIELRDAGRTHPLYAGKPEQFDALCMHRDDVLEAGSALTVLSHNSHCGIQAVVSADASTPEFWGVQYHPELRFSDIARYIKRSEVAGFSQTEALEKSLYCRIESLEQLISDLHILAEDEPSSELVHKYQLEDTLISRPVHEQELINWLNLISAS